MTLDILKTALENYLHAHTDRFPGATIWLNDEALWIFDADSPQLYLAIVISIWSEPHIKTAIAHGQLLYKMQMMMCPNGFAEAQLLFLTGTIPDNLPQVLLPEVFSAHDNDEYGIALWTIDDTDKITEWPG